MKWTVHIETAPKRVNHAAVCIRDMIYSFGGYNSTIFLDWEPISVDILNTKSLKWSKVLYNRSDIVPFQRYGHTTVAYGDKVYMWGGKNNTVSCDNLCCFDTKTLKWSTPAVSGAMPYSRDGHSACLIANKMYIFGGFEYIAEQYSQEVYCLNLDTMHWTFINAQGTIPSHRDFHSAVAIENKMYIFGGRGDLNSPYNSHEEIYCSTVFYLDTIEEKWVAIYPVGDWPEGRRSHSSWIYQDYMYIFGGFNGFTKTHFNDLYRYSLKDNIWEFIDVGGLVPCPRRRAACLLHNDVVYLFGGTSPSPLPENVEYNEDRMIDNGDLHLLDYQPSLKTLCILVVLKHNLNTTILPRGIMYDNQ